MQYKLSTCLRSELSWRLNIPIGVPVLPIKTHEILFGHKDQWWDFIIILQILILIWEFVNSMISFPASFLRGEICCLHRCIFLHISHLVESFPVMRRLIRANVTAPGQERASHVQPDIVTSSSTPSSEQGDPDKLEEEEEERGRGAVLPPSWAPECSFGGQVVAERESGRLAGGVGPLRRASTSPSWAPENEQLVEEEEQEEEEGGAKPPSDQDICDSASEVTSGENFEEDEVEEVERISARMNTFRKEERKPSLFTRAIERLSFRFLLYKCFSLRHH